MCWACGSRQRYEAPGTIIGNRAGRRCEECGMARGTESCRMGWLRDSGCGRREEEGWRWYDE